MDAELKNQDPEFLVDSFNLVFSYLSNYGYYILAGSALLYYMYNRFYPGLKDRYDDRSTSAHVASDPDKFMARNEALERSRLRMQEEYNRKAAEAKRLNEQSNDKGKEIEKLLEERNLKSKNNAKKQGLRDDYNPLMSSAGGSCSFRPRRGAGSSGGS